MTPIFVDAVYWIAVELVNDQNHAQANMHWQRVLLSLPPLVTTSYVIDEVVTFFNSRGLHSKAVQIGNYLLHSPAIEVIHIDESLF